jgi:glycosyltransferase involved in cell wall biosynthesis
MKEETNSIEMPLLTVVMAAYNAEQYISSAIQSVIDQTYSNWELIVVNDGSIDKTEAKIFEFKDTRIRYFSQINMGVSAARNLALKNMKGSFFCMLDADDILPQNSLKARLDKMISNPEAEFVDGTVIVKNNTLDKVLKKYRFSYYGDPTPSLVRLDGNCFFGPSWMIRIKPEKTYLFDENITHGEELMLYLSISNGAIYTSVEEPVLIYRKSENSAMSNLKGLEAGYKKILFYVKKMENVTVADKRYMKFRILRIMFLSYLRRLDFWNAASVFFRLRG